MKASLLVPFLALSVAACGGNKATNNSANASAANASAANASAASNQAGNASANTAAPVAATGAITPAELRAMIQRDGARATVRTLSEGGTEAAPNRFATVERGIASGDQSWLDLVPLIRPGTDGETGEGLSMVLQDALSKNAAGVLRLISSGSSIDDAQGICGESATETVRSDRDAAIAAVEAVSDPALARAKASCLTALRATAAQ